MTTYQVLKKYGWRQQIFGTTDTGFCLLGAFYHAHPRASHGGPLYRTLQRAINCGPTHPTIWNDDPTRTVAEVLRVTKKAQKVGL